MSRETTAAERKKYFKYVDEDIKNKNFHQCGTDNCKCGSENGTCWFFKSALDYFSEHKIIGIKMIDCPIYLYLDNDKYREAATKFFYDRFSKFLISKEDIE